ncbi:NACHT, LRR and PYD domains-containing protein 3 isoform X1 [Hydra vulgaris]|uniref:NACHT, LRR and PYD domains-containing protein 3 isoform X1 n=1 Tax=Hydra vulgaris TaxID=6087 RepID=UPI0032EA3A97
MGNIRMEESSVFQKNDESILFSQVFKFKFSDSVGVDWRTLGCLLNIKDNHLDMINQDYTKTNEKAYFMLSKWMQMNKNPTLEELKTALKNMERIDLIRKLDELTKTSNSPEITHRFYSQKDTSEICTALKNCYLVNYGKINEIQPPSKVPANVDLLHQFVDLCIVDAVNAQMDVLFSVERKKFLEKQMSYTPISYSEIFMKEKSVTLVSGIAGIGKTWLLRKCLLDWSNNLIWKIVELVFYLECRKLNQHQNISNINELLNVFYKDITNDFNIRNNTAMFIIDGLDEFKYLNELVNPNLTCSYPIVNALAEIRKYKSVVAGRVYAIDRYQSISTEHSDKLIIQIMGFNENGINDYVENNVKEEKKEVVRATLKRSPFAKAMASVPFYLSCISKIISDSNKIYATSFLTMTDLYANIFLFFLQKHIIKNDGLVYQLMENENNKKYVLSICRIAFELFIANKFIFSKEEVLLFITNFNEVEECLFGFIERVETHLGYHYQFAHLTLMEFCASVYAYNCLSCKEIMDNKKLQSCLSMISGLFNKSQNSLIKFLVNLNPSKKSIEESSFLLSILDRRLSKYNDKSLFIECFYESQSFTDEIKSIVDKRRWWWISIDDGKTSYETSCDNYFVNHFIKSGRKLTWLNVDKNILSDEEKNLLILCSTNVCDVNFYRPIKFEGWKPKDKIEKLRISISHDFITKKDFEENFLPWINLCEELHLYLHDDIDFIDDVYEWIRCSNVKKFKIKYRGKDFRNLDELKNFITRKKCLIS